ncbi:MAG TPA: glycosyltransferase family A protein [Gemmatimonadaceae bacterium]
MRLLALAQLVALIVVCMRLARGRRRVPPVEPREDGVRGTSVSVVVPTHNEAGRIGPCLAGLQAQGAPLDEVIVVDGGSTDGTPTLVDAAGSRDPRVRRLDEPRKPSGLVGRPWAITLGLDVVSFAPCIVAPGAGARWLQPAFLATLVYRFGPPGVDAPDPDRAMANGQCLLIRRDVLERAGGYGIAARSYCDDVRIVRHLAASGARVGFLDAPRLLDVEMYPTGRETWRAWPRSLNLRDASSARWRWLDAVLLILAQALPIPILLGLALGVFDGRRGWGLALVAVNAALITVRVLLAAATAHSFARRGLAYWLSPLADAAAVLRVVETMARRPREWRGEPRPVAAAS